MHQSDQPGNQAEYPEQDQQRASQQQNAETDSEDPKVPEDEDTIGHLAKIAVYQKDENDIMEEFRVIGFDQFVEAVFIRPTLGLQVPAELVYELSNGKIDGNDLERLNHECRRIAKQLGYTFVQPAAADPHRPT